ncbi:MAG: hypothetical protein GC168_18840 [Candidatus Hydrogenedens sp.]|nr:hypothetical protein [Candidatus Hydrogenedens sp.]
MGLPAKKVYREARKIWKPELKPAGFVEKDGRYYRTLDSGVVHLIGIGKDPHGGETFRVMCGVDALPLKEEVGGFGYMKHDGLMHLTPKGWDLNSGRWPCITEEETKASVDAILPLIRDLALPYLAPITTITDVGNEINETRKPGLGWMKARLFQLDGDLPRALETIERYAAWAAKPRNWGTKEHQQEDLARAARIRSDIEQALSASK